MTFKQWQSTYEKEYQSLLWLRCMTDEHNPRLVDALMCTICTRFEADICGLKNFSSAWICGLNKHRTSNIIDHAKRGATSSLTIEDKKHEELALNNWDKWFKNDEELDDSELDEYDLEMLN